MITCPCCGQTIETRAPIDALKTVSMGFVPATVVGMLIDAYPRGVTAEFLISEIYRGSREPETAMDALRVQLSRIRDRFAQHGWTVSRGKPGRGNTSLYRLEELP
jgi:hypothetical protein